MPRMNLTDETVRTLKTCSGRMDYIDTAEGVPFEFGIRIGARGKNWWTRYTLYGVRRRYNLGTFPQIKREEALWEAFDAHQKVRQGLDPQVVRSVRRNAKTVELVAEVYLKEVEGVLAKRTYDGYDFVLTRDVLPAWGKRSLDSLTRSDIRNLLRKIRDRGAPARTNITLSVISNLFKLAEAEGWVSGNPCIGLPRLCRQRRRTDFFSPDEIHQIWNYTESLGTVTAWCWRMLLLTGQRPGEVQHMDHQHIDGPWWQLPLTKNGRPHLVYLAEPALEIVKRVKVDKPRRVDGELRHPVFPGRSNGTSFSGWGNFGTKARSRIEIPHFRPHTARHTFITWLCSQDVEMHLVKAFVNHTSNDVTSGYNHYRYRSQRQKWFTRYAEYVMSCARGEGARVLQFTTSPSI